MLPLLASAALHAAALGVCLVAVSPLPPPAAPDDQAIEMVFEAPPPRPRPPPPQPEAPATAAPAPVMAPASVATAPPAASAPEPAAPAVDPRWSRSVSEWLEAHRTYPDEARRRGEEGRVALRFTVDRSGAVLDVELVHSSGSPRLDAAALALLRTAALPPFAASMTAGQITITMQIRYGLMP